MRSLLAALAVTLALAACSAAPTTSEPGPSSGITPAPSAASEETDEPVDVVAFADISADQLCAALQALDVEPLVGATPYEYEPSVPEEGHAACLASADAESAVTGGIDDNVVTGAAAEAGWQQFLAFEGAVEIDGFGAPTVYDEDPVTGFLPVVTIGMRTGEGLVFLQFAPVVGAPIPPQTVTVEVFADLLDELGIPH